MQGEALQGPHCSPTAWGLNPRLSLGLHRAEKEEASPGCTVLGGSWPCLTCSWTWGAAQHPLAYSIQARLPPDLLYASGTLDDAQSPLFSPGLPASGVCVLVLPQERGLGTSHSTTAHHSCSALRRVALEVSSQTPGSMEPPEAPGVLPGLASPRPSCQLGSVSCAQVYGTCGSLRQGPVPEVSAPLPG